MNFQGRSFVSIGKLIEILSNIDENTLISCSSVGDLSVFSKDGMIGHIDFILEEFISYHEDKIDEISEL